MRRKIASWCTLLLFLVTILVCGNGFADIKEAENQNQKETPKIQVSIEIREQMGEYETEYGVQYTAWDYPTMTLADHIADVQFRARVAIDAPEDAQILADTYLVLVMGRDVFSNYAIHTVEKWQEGEYWHVCYIEKQYAGQDIPFAHRRGIHITMNAETGALLFLENFDE